MADPTTADTDIALALAERRIVDLERELDRTRAALRAVVDRFTAPYLPDAPCVPCLEGWTP